MAIFGKKRKKRKARRRKLLKVFVCIVLIIMAIKYSPLLYSNISSNFCISKNSDSAPVFVAHRGLSGMYPQNTTVAFEKAVEYGFYGYEFDIHTTKDGEWVVIHNDTVDDMTDGEGEVASFTLEEITKLNIDNGNGIKDYPDLKVPTLKEALAVCENSDIVPGIEIKNCDVSKLSALKETLDELSLSERAIIISFEKEYLSEYRKLDSDIDMFYLAHQPTKEDIDWCFENGNTGINFNHNKFYKCIGALSYAKEKGIDLAAWTVDSTILCDVMVGLFDVEIITTNKILP